jgi:hypothetical protein
LGEKCRCVITPVIRMADMAPSRKKVGTNCRRVIRPVSGLGKSWLIVEETGKIVNHKAMVPPSEVRGCIENGNISVIIENVSIIKTSRDEK